MKILVPFKRVADVASGASLRSFDAVQWVINPFDQIAIEEALRIKERGQATEIVGVTIGPSEAEEQVRAALAMGVDRAIRVEEARTLDPYALARILRNVVALESPALVLMGKQAVDDDSSQVGQMLAGLLNWSQATFVSKIELTDGGKALRCTRETDRGLEIISARLPAVVTTDLRLNEPRYVSLPGLMKARRKPIQTLDCGALQVNVAPRTTVLATVPVKSRSAGVTVDSAEALVANLRNKEKLF
jgi:electron transfer flavoprotein beta subunit